jgi:adenosylcobalamin-dependent ribonucleoside-triphosphate reductase
MLLSKSFLNKFEDNPQWPSLLGQFVYLRTYSRYLPNKKRRETWKETVTRVVEYSMGLDTITDRVKQEAEARKLFESMYNLSVFPAGRTLWTGGTEAAKKYPLSNFNCSFMIVDDVQAFLDAFYLMMLGTGVGFRVLPQDVVQFPPIITGVAIEHKEYTAKRKADREENSRYAIDSDVMYLSVGDSKEGWVWGLEALFEAFFKGYKKIVVDYDSVRPAGEQLKTFGGRASGHVALRDMYEKIVKVLNEGTDRLSTLQAMDVMNLIGEAVVVGGVRRSSEITLFDINDTAVLDAKVDLWSDPAKEDKRFRSMSNNSVYFTEKPTKEQLTQLFSRILNNGEPGFINAEAASKRRPWYAGTNPCAEILLADNGVCNLSEINVRNFVKNDEYGGYLDMIELEGAVVQATRLGVRMATLELELPHWNKVQQRDRLTGVSLTGYVEAFDALGVSTTEEDLNAIRVIDRDGGGRPRLRFYTLRDVLAIIGSVAQETALGYSAELRIPAPLLVTTVKPSGTIAQLPTVSSGAHASYAPLYVRRVRISSKDPLAQAMRESGYPIFPEATSCMPEVFASMSDADKEETLKNALTWVVEFPIKTSAKKASAEESAVEQLNRYFILQKYWTDHNTSITVTFSPEEVDDIIELLLRKWENYIGVSFLPKFTTAYPLMPYQAIDEEEYQRRLAEVSGVTGKSIIELLEKHENVEVDDDLGTDCEGGACPIR